MLVEVAEKLLVESETLVGLFVALEDFDRVPADALFGNLALDGLLDVGDGVLDAAGEDMRARRRIAFARQFYRLRGGLAGPLTRQRISRESFMKSMSSPFLRTTSIMLMATTVGMPSSRSWVVR